MLGDPLKNWVQNASFVQQFLHVFLTEFRKYSLLVSFLLFVKKPKYFIQTFYICFLLHIKICIINPPWPFGPTVIVWFWFSPNLSHVLGTCSSHVTMFSHLLKSVTHVLHHEIHSFHHLRHGLHLEFKFYIVRGWCVVLIWHNNTWLMEPSSDTKWCEPRDHMVTQPTRKDTNSRKAK